MKLPDAPYIEIKVNDNPEYYDMKRINVLEKAKKIKKQNEMTLVSLAPNSHGKITQGSNTNWKNVLIGFGFIIIQAFIFYKYHVFMKKILKYILNKFGLYTKSDITQAYLNGKQEEHNQMYIIDRRAYKTGVANLSLKNDKH